MYHIETYMSLSSIAFISITYSACDLYQNDTKIIKMGGTISFYDFMNFALNDPINGYYGSGKVELGVRGDFVTSPSLSDDFAFLDCDELYTRKRKKKLEQCGWKDDKLERSF